MDLWINTPRRPWEACGTSGMKVLANGGLNISELDGWWAEAYTPEIGWAIGDGREHGDDPAWDASEVESLYILLEQQVVPEFYDRDAQGMPSRWLGRVRESMATLTPEFSASRAIREYTNDHYLPAAAGYNARAANDGELGAEVLQWQRSITEQWGTLRFGDVTRRDKGWPASVPNSRSSPGSVDAAQFRVELYAGSNRGQCDRSPKFLLACKSSAKTLWHYRLFRLLPSKASSRRLHSTPHSIARRRLRPSRSRADSLAAMSYPKTGSGRPYPLGATVCAGRNELQHLLGKCLQHAVGLVRPR